MSENLDLEGVGQILEGMEDGDEISIRKMSEGSDTVYEVANDETFPEINFNKDYDGLSPGQAESYTF